MDNASVSYDTTPTIEQYDAFQHAYDYFNEALFDGGLSQCLITLQRRSRTRGYFSGARFSERTGDDTTDEIAMNPAYFARTDIEILSTLVHEMAHLWQQYYGNPSRSRYHNREWANKMMELGLTPTATGEPGGKQTGQSITHMIAPGGPYERAAQALLATGFALRWQSVEVQGGKTTTKSKVKYTCRRCGLNAWAKPVAVLVCGECAELMQAEE
jgi:predicted SprT family Zn-dependent metalloprotease